MKYDKLINLELTQLSGQTSQPPWIINDKNQFQGLLILNESPVLVKLSQNNINSLNIDYELPINVDTYINEKKLKKEIFDEINMDLYDLLFLLKQEYLKLIRISKNFNKVIKDNIENYENVNTMHIRIELN